MKKIILAALMASTVALAGLNASADTKIKISDAFPDQYFREYVADEFDLNGDGYLSQSECDKVTEISASFSVHRVKELTGIKYFKNLTYLNVIYQDIESVDLSKNTKLEELWIRGNALSKLDLSNNKALKKLSCGESNLTSLNVADFTKLEDIDCFNSKLTSIDISGCTALKDLDVYGNQMKKLYIGDNINLERVDCHSNKITSLDVSKNKKLTKLSCYDNDLKELDISNNTELESLNCSDNRLTELDLTGIHGLTHLYCHTNKITYLDISPSKGLVIAYHSNEEYDDYNDPSYIIYDYTPDDFDRTGRGDYTLEVDIGVKIKANYIKLTADNENPVCGKTTKIKVTRQGIDKNAIVKWSTSDKTAATVDSSGVVKAKKAGYVTITADVAGVRDSIRLFVLYKDVTNKKDFWYNPTNRLTQMGVVKGYDNMTLFKPANKCTRAQMVTFIWRLEGCPEPDSATCTFSDVEPDDYFFKPVIWAVEKGITTGYSDGKFKPQNVCTRAQTVTFLWRLAGSPDYMKNYKCKFSDVKKSDYYYLPVIWASECGIVSGYKDNTFKPKGECLRRQMVTFLYKYHLVETDDMD
ncbi:MAG: S-layer homology domain-containing protein [Saccharofermentans sp.]|nr:S-layer homology domain-containing protein [Saccharofermentans sp.]